ncbi:collagen binding domain-containing protein [Saccharomonospora iraqiensis]|uniref:hypothetical protein n=1 Tax=Saccharomonospora iraqiensis TaxID=52698 RepID=UPI00022E0767|nr:hypothetical protein [Saccharomonospora iraqiensis]
MARRRLFTTVRGPGGSLLATLALTALALATVSVVAVPPSATAEVREGIGHETTPGQSWGGRDRSAEHDWLGSYEVGGEQVFCVSFALKAPDTDETYEPGDELLDKWGEPLDPDVAANISYLLLRYGDTRDADEAAALAHLLHSWTAAPRDSADLDPDKPFTEIAYDVEAHLDALPDGARAAVDRMRDEAETYRGPWEVELTAPEGDQTIGTPAEWSVRITNAEGTGVPDVDVALDLTDLEPGQGDASGAATVTTGEDGAAAVALAPTGEEPTVRATLAAPAERPYVREPVTTDTQRVVSTGGEQELTAEAATTARTAPGAVRVAKVDEETGDGIAGVPLELTGEDGTSPAVGRDGEPLVGEDGEPLVVTSAGADGTAAVENLRTPQTVCLTEVRPPNGYGDAFDPENPPSACGELTPGGTLTLRIANVPDDVPETIPAGEPTLTVERAATTSGAPVGALLSLGGLALLASVVTGRVARRRFARR